MILIFQSKAAANFNVAVNVPPQVENYDGNTNVTFQATIYNNDDNCDVECTWTTSMGTSSQPGDLVHVGFTNSKPFDINVVAQGTSGTASFTLTGKCKEVKPDPNPKNCFFPDPTYVIQTSPNYVFKFRFNGDGICTTSREKCAAYTTYLAAPNDCKCSSEKECKPTSNRGADDRGCATFCGNKIIETKYENCNNCRDDVGKCDGDYCSVNTECEGKYCVHNKCSHLAYVTGDTFCDKDVGENCKTSGLDCACGSTERCNPSGFCETFCGNGICEEKERGVCKADCTWCGTAKRASTALRP